MLRATPAKTTKFKKTKLERNFLHHNYLHKLQAYENINNNSALGFLFKLRKIIIIHIFILNLAKIMIAIFS